MLLLAAPGQGAQTPGFLSEWLELPGFADRLGALSELAGCDLISCGTSADAEEIRDTAIAQPLAPSRWRTAWRGIASVLRRAPLSAFWGVVAAAALCLEGMGPNAVETLKQALPNPSAQVRFFAAEALAYLNDASGADMLAAVVAGYNMVSRYVVALEVGVPATGSRL